MDQNIIWNCVCSITNLLQVAFCILWYCQSMLRNSIGSSCYYFLSYLYQYEVWPFTGAMCYIELGCLIPQSGAETVYLKENVRKGGGQGRNFSLCRVFVLFTTSIMQRRTGFECKALLLRYSIQWKMMGMDRSILSEPFRKKPESLYHVQHNWEYF